MPQTEIDVPAVVAVGAKVGAVADGMEDTAAGMEGWSYQGQDAVAGSYLCAGDLSGAAHFWAREIRELAASVRQYGTDLATTAQAYAAYDRMSADELRQFDDPARPGPRR